MSAKTDREHFSDELDRVDRAELGDDGVDRYCFYRARGIASSDAWDGAKAWLYNRDDQRARRLSHETGATGWLGAC